MDTLAISGLKNKRTPAKIPIPEALKRVFEGPRAENYGRNFLGRNGPNLAHLRLMRAKFIGFTYIRVLPATNTSKKGNFALENAHIRGVARFGFHTW